MRNLESLYLGLLFCFISLSVFSKISIAAETLTPNLSIRDGETLVSLSQIFKLGFFSAGNPKNRYVGIWYNKIPAQTIVWVANRDNPVTDSSGVLKISEEGNLVLLNRAASVIWSSNATKTQNPVLQLLDSGNLVLREERDDNPGNYLWQSFDYPTDTLLPGMKLGWNLKTGLNRFLSSWKSADDPSSGDYSFRIDPHGFPQAYLMKRLIVEYRSGPWNGLQFSGVPEMKPTEIFNFTFTSNEEEVYYSFQLVNESVVSRLIMNSTGMLQRFTWLDTTQIWSLFWYAPKDQCDNYKECGPYGVCDTNASPVCKCMEGFEPKDRHNWDLRDGSGGCVPKSKFECRKGDGFLPVKGMKLPESSRSFVDKSLSLAECETECVKNCSCTAYSNSEITGGGSGCVFWVGDLLDLRQYTEGGQDLYVRVAASVPGASAKSDDGSNKRKRLTTAVGVTVGLGILAFALSACCLWKRKTIRSVWNRKKEERATREKSQDIQLFDVVISSGRDNSGEYKKDDLELPLVDFDTIAAATDNFSEANELGKGGFGCVYKGELLDGPDIAVKRLSKNSGQGVEEFKNEVLLIAKLQHRNLVRLLGCCIHGEERMLIYEYMQNRSLDNIIFDKAKSSSLDWQKRFNVIAGISRGLLYLHQDSRFRIIHRDLKASNILLDGEMNPKISDFGMARIFGGDQIEANTKRIVGTYGYMSPEYAMDGLFSVKSDVFSFGVLVLEIVSGKKNRGFYYANNQLNLLGHAWKLWREGKALELMDESLGDSFSTYEVLRCIQVGLLCVQERAEERPTMSSVVLMLSSETATIPQPKHPGFCLGKSPLETDSSSAKQESCTVNQVTVTMLDAR